MYVSRQLNIVYRKTNRCRLFTGSVQLCDFFTSGQKD